MTNGPNDYVKSVLKDLYGMDDFITFFEGLRTMVQEYTLGGPTIASMDLGDLLYGYTDERINYRQDN